MINTEEIVKAFELGKVCLVARYIEGDRENVELVETFDNIEAGREYLAANDETEFSTLFSSYRLESETFGNTPITIRAAIPEAVELELKGIWRN